MTESSVVCPYCNSQIDGVADRAKPVCPRCEAQLATAIVEKLPVKMTAAPLREPITVPGKKKTLAAILGIMALMASITIGYSLWTQKFRRLNDFKKGIVLTEPASQTPDELNTVGLLPARCNIIGAVNLADLRGNPVAQAAFLEQAPRSLAWLREQLKDASGLALDDIEQISLGVEITEKPPKIFVIVQTKAPYDPQAVVKSFPNVKALSLRGRPLVRFPLPYVGDGVAWCLGERHLAFLFRVEQGPLDDLEAIPVRPRAKLDGSSDALKTLVKERVDKQSLAWLAADMAPAAGFADFLSLVGAKVEPYRPLLDSKAFTLTIKADSDIVVLAQVRPNSAKGMKALEETLRDVNWRGETSKKIETTPPDEEPWVTLQLRYAPAAIRELFSQGPLFKKS